jgi:hypothetical protein
VYVVVLPMNNEIEMIIMDIERLPTHSLIVGLDLGSKENTQSIKKIISPTENTTIDTFVAIILNPPG